MNQHPKLYTALGLVLAVLLGLILYFYPRTAPAPLVEEPDALFSCATGSFDVTYGEGTATLALSDGRTLTLTQVQSGSGIRYAADGVELMSKGSWAVLTENGTATYDQCVVNLQQQGEADARGWKPFTDMGKTISFSYPDWARPTNPGQGYTQEWAAGSADLGSIVARVTIPDTFEPNTNFRDARFSVGVSVDAHALASCMATGTPVTINGIPFTKSTTSDAGAGNRYDTTAYRTIHEGQCYSIEYTIHTTNLANYPEEAGITAYDPQKVTAVLEGMVQSFRFVE